MLVIGHRGARGLAPENTLESLRAGYNAGADMLEFDIRLTRDRIPVIVHDIHTYRTHKKARIIPLQSLAELEATLSSPSLATLEQVLDEFFGRILLNIELKSIGSAPIVIALLEKYVKKPSDWDNIIVSSFVTSELLWARSISEKVNLALLMYTNPFLFLGYQRRLQLTAVGFHRLYMNRFAVEIATRCGLFTYVYTVNLSKTASLLEAKGIDGIVTDRPDTIIKGLNTPSLKV